MQARRFQRLLKIRSLLSFGDDLLGLFYPRSCVECGRQLLPQMEVFCHVCHPDLPRCAFAIHAGNRLEEMFYGRVRIEAATSYLYFKKYGVVQRMMHQLKYGGREDIGAWIGDAHSKEIVESLRFKSIDLILPVPLHPAKKRKRGYNQVDAYAQSLARKLEVPFAENTLIRKRKGKSLSRQSRVERNESMKNVFSLVSCEDLKGKHVLLVDDIITSGATLEACADKVLNLPGTRVSLASMAFTL